MTLFIILFAAAILFLLSLVSFCFIYSKENLFGAALNSSLIIQNSELLFASPLGCLEWNTFFFHPEIRVIGLNCQWSN